MGLGPHHLTSFSFNYLLKAICFLGGSVVENPPAMEMWVPSQGWEDPLEEEEMAAHSSILTWEIPWTEEPGGLQFKGSQELGMT